MLTPELEKVARNFAFRSGGLVCAVCLFFVWLSGLEWGRNIAFACAIFITMAITVATVFIAYTVGEIFIEKKKAEKEKEERKAHGLRRTPGPVVGVFGYPPQPQLFKREDAS